MSEISLMRAEIAALKTMVERLQPSPASPFLRGDDEAATYAGFRSRSAFRRWAKEEGIRPVVRGGLNLWSRKKLDAGGWS